MRVVNTDVSVERFCLFVSDVNPRSERERSGVGRVSGWIPMPRIPSTISVSCAAVAHLKSFFPFRIVPSLNSSPAGRSFPPRVPRLRDHQLLFEHPFWGAHDVVLDCGKPPWGNAPHLTQDAWKAPAAAPSSVPPCGPIHRTLEKSFSGVDRVVS
jgi:hypothetical protein